MDDQKLYLICDIGTAQSNNRTLRAKSWFLIEPHQYLMLKQQTPSIFVPENTFLVATETSTYTQTQQIYILVLTQRRYI